MEFEYHPSRKLLFKIFVMILLLVLLYSFMIASADVNIAIILGFLIIIYPTLPILYYLYLFRKDVPKIVINEKFIYLPIFGGWKVKYRKMSISKIEKSLVHRTRKGDVAKIVIIAGDRQVSVRSDFFCYGDVERFVEVILDRVLKGKPYQSILKK